MSDNWRRAIRLAVLEIRANPIADKYILIFREYSVEILGLQLTNSAAMNDNKAKP